MNEIKNIKIKIWLKWNKWMRIKRRYKRKMKKINELKENEDWRIEVNEMK